LCVYHKFIIFVKTKIMSDIKDFFKKELQQKGDRALLNVKYMGISYDEIKYVYSELGLPSPITLIKNTVKTYTGRGWGNGYVRIAEGHKYHEKAYDDISVSVHGGLTFGQHIFDNDKHFSEGYWVGFDTAHYGDDILLWPRDRVLEETIDLFKAIYELS